MFEFRRYQWSIHVNDFFVFTMRRISVSAHINSVLWFLLSDVHRYQPISRSVLWFSLRDVYRYQPISHSVQWFSLWYIALEFARMTIGVGFVSLIYFIMLKNKNVVYLSCCMENTSHVQWRFTPYLLDEYCIFPYRIQINTSYILHCYASNNSLFISLLRTANFIIRHDYFILKKSKYIADNR